MLSKSEKTNNRSTKMGVTEEGTSMSDESKKKVVLPSKKVMALFILRKTKHRGCFIRININIVKPQSKG